MNKLTLDDLSFTGKKVLVRVDFNVPLGDDGHVSESTRIRASLPTIHNLLDYDATVILMSHFGRPKGKRVDKYSLKPVVVELERLLGKRVKFAPDCIGPEVEEMVKSLAPGEVMLLENVRFHPGEGENDPEFARQLSRLGDIFVNDAFGAAHRKQASLHAITEFYPGRAAAGRLMMRELRLLKRALHDPKKPFIGIVGGAKISSKISTIESLLPHVDKLLIGGGMAYTLIKAQGGQIGNSLCEDEKLTVAEDILRGAEADKILLPVDSVAAQDPGPGSERRTYPSSSIPDGWSGFDLGKEACAQYVDIIKSAQTVFWNGPVGLFEREPYDLGTKLIAQALVELTSQGGITVVGGGDTMAALSKFKLPGSMTHISTGGGALLEYMEGITLPGVDVLSDSEV